MFNHLTYHIVLCPDFAGVWHLVKGGRHLNLESMTISEVKVDLVLAGTTRQRDNQPPTRGIKEAADKHI
jgi:hypothetical protein